MKTLIPGPLKHLGPVKIFFVLICSCALVCAAWGGTTRPASSSGKPAASSGTQAPRAQAPQRRPTNVVQPPQGKPQIQHIQPPQHVAPPGVHPAQVPPGTYAAQIRQPGQPQPQGGRLQTATAVQPAAPPLTKEQQEEVYAQEQGFRSAEQFCKWQNSGRVETPVGVVASGAPISRHRIPTATSGIYPSPKTPVTFTARHYDLPKTSVPPNEKVTFQLGSHIPGCQNWQHSKYDAFRNYTPTWQDKTWWITHHRRIVLVFGGWYYWNAGYWFPAWGYHSDSVYSYDGPIYAYNDLAPDQVVANVQATLQELGYYHGPVNGYLDSATREAITNYQHDHGLYATSAIDEPTLASLGMA
jgi:Putative peptidoglycan binding domain